MQCVERGKLVMDSLYVPIQVKNRTAFALISFLYLPHPFIPQDIYIVDFLYLKKRR